VQDGFHDRRNPMETVMRKFTTLFLLALAMTVGANQTFAAQAGGPNDTGKNERADRPDRENDGEPNLPAAILIGPDAVGPVVCIKAPCFPPRRPRPIKIKKEAEDCSCKHKVMRVNGRFMPFIDCYNTVEINGRDQLRYCEK
jgi:hypothetical protein